LSTTTAVLPKPRSQKVPPVRPVANKIKLPERTLENLSDIFKLLGDKSRLKILLALAQEEELHVSALCELLDQSQPAVSHHLTLLRMRNLVGYRRDGKHNYYRIDCGLVPDLLEHLFSDPEDGARHLHFSGFSLAFRRK